VNLQGGRRSQRDQSTERHFLRMNKGGIGLYNGGTGRRNCLHQAFRNVFCASCMINKPGLPWRVLQAQSWDYEPFCYLQRLPSVLLDQKHPFLNFEAWVFLAADRRLEHLVVLMMED
jgi:hypothetical protein